MCDYTPWPWVVKRNGESLLSNFRIEGDQGLRIVAAVVYREADADLMAAAPKTKADRDALLAACKAALKWARTDGNHGGNPYCHDFMRLAEAAVAQAEGKETE